MKRPAHAPPHLSGFESEWGENTRKHLHLETMNQQRQCLPGRGNYFSL